MQTIQHDKLADIVIEIPVEIDADAGITDLIGATVTASATDNFITVVGAATLSPDGLTVTVTYAENVFVAGVFRLSVYATLGTITQKIAEADLVVA